MKTACAHCRAPIAQRLWLTGTDMAGVVRPSDFPLFAETYECGAVRICGLVRQGAEWPRKCVEPHTGKEP